MSNEVDSKFIDGLIADKRITSVFLSNGVRLEGALLQQDAICFIMTRDNKNKGEDKTQLVYKNMVATISPNN